MIPKILHYCFGLSTSFGEKKWELVHHVCLKSAVERIKPTDVRFYCEYEPEGPWWHLSRELVSVEKISAPQEIFGNPLIHGAHQADVVRLEKLLTMGGIYLDTDVFVHKDFADLLDHQAVMGEQNIGGTVRGLCNAVILAEAQAPFLSRWYGAYHSFRSKGRDEYWDEHSVCVPYALSRQFPDEVTKLPNSAFFWPAFTQEELAMIFVSKTRINISNAYATHLWESIAWDSYLEDLTPGQVRAVDTNFHFWARPMLEGLPDNYGQAPARVRLARRLRKLVRCARAALRTRSTQPQQARV
jgi:hypothetical protein